MAIKPPKLNQAQEIHQCFLNLREKNVVQSIIVDDFSKTSTLYSMRVYLHVGTKLKNAENLCIHLKDKYEETIYSVRVTFPSNSISPRRLCIEIIVRNDPTLPNPTKVQPLAIPPT